MANRAPEFTEGGSITRISTDAAGGQANYDSLSPVFSPDGTKVAFYSYASNLVPGDTNGTYDIFVKDLTTHAITRVSTDASGAQGDYYSYEPVFSPDGTKVAFSSSASNLVAGDTNGTHDIFVKDLTTGVVTRVAVDGAGAQANGYSYNPVFSPDGTKVAFYSTAPNLVPGDTNSTPDLFVKDLTTGTVTRVSTDASGTQGNSYSYNPVFAPDGTKVAFYSYASNLVPGDTNNTADVFVKDLTTGVVTRVSTDVSGTQENSGSYRPVFSPDGTKVAFYSDASNLVPGDTNNTADVFVKDLTTGAVTRVSIDAGGIQANSPSYNPVFSPDGTKVAFYSYATNLVPGDTNNTPDVFVKDLTTGAVTRVSTDAAGAQGNGYSDNPVFSPDGTKVAFNSGAPNLVPGDTNYTTDIFVKDLSVAKAALTDDAAKSSLTGAGKIFFTDADAGDSHTVSVAPQAGALGVLTTVVVPVAGGASHVDWSYSVDTALIAALGTGQTHTETFTLTLDDGQGGTATRDVTVTLNGIDDAPVFTSPATVSFAEGAAGPVLQVAAQDPEGAALTYALSGADAALFDLAADGTLSFKSTPDYEAPADAGADNIYNVTITASDGALSTAQNVAVTVTDVGENAPQWASVGGITRVSTSSAGAQANGASSEGVLSADGTKLYFVSGASNLVPGSTGNVADLYVKDLSTGQTTRLLNDCGAYDISLSPDGTKIAFASQATNLVGSDTNGQYDIFVLNLTNGAVTRVTTSASGAEGTGGNALGYYNPTFTPDSSKVVYSSGFSNLVSGDTNNSPDILIKDLNTGAISRISTNASSQEATGAPNNYYGSHEPVVSPDGSKIVFWSYATNLVAGDTNGQADVFLKDLTTGAITRLSTSASGAQANYASQGAVFSPNGTKVAFYSSATNLVPGISSSGIYIKDIQTGAIEFVAPSGYAQVAYSPDGTKIAFISSATNLVDGDTNGKPDIFVKDVTTGEITRVSTAADGLEANNTPGSSLAFTPDGKSIVFSSYASNLVPGDTNAAMDIFIKDVTPPTVSSATLTDDAAKSSLTAAGRFYFTDADANDIHTVSVAPQAGALGTVTASVVPRADGPDRIDWSYSIDSALVASLGAGQSRTETFALSLSDGTSGAPITQIVTVTVNGIDDAPAFSSPAAVTVGENSGGAVLKVVATDPDGRAVGYTLSGADAGLFNFAPDGTLSFRAPPNFEAPADAGGNNVYDLVVTATDGTQSATQAITVTVGDVLESGNAAPQFLDGKPGGGITRVSTTAAGAQVTNDSWKPDFSPDGTKVVFHSASNAYVPGDTNGNYDVFIKDLATGAVSLVSTTSSGAPAVGGSTDGVFSPDGTKVAFVSTAGNLVDGDGNGSADIFVKDLATGAVTLVSGTETGDFGTSSSREPRFSPDGTKVAFISSSALTAADTDGAEDLYIRDLPTGQLTLVTEGNSYIYDSSERDYAFSPDGTKVVFLDRTGQVTVKDLTTGAVSVVSTNAAGVVGNDYLNSDPVFSPDGTKVAFASRANNFVPNDTNNSVDVFVKDLVTGEITRVSTSASGAAGNNSSEQPQFSPDGTKILFRSNATNLVPGSQPGANFYIKDLVTGDVERVSSSAANVQLGYTDTHASFSPDGTSVIFTSYAPNIVPGDTNGAQDIFIKELGDKSVTSGSLTEAGGAQGLAAEGQIYFSDSDAGDTHTVSVTPQAGTLGTLTAIVVDRPSGPDRVDWNYVIDQAQFSGLHGGETRVEVFTLTLDDGHGNSTTQTVSVSLTNINDAPVITAPLAVGFEENGSGLVLQVSATDADGDALTYGISGTDAALFEMSADGRLTFKSPPNFEAPADAGGDNVYDLILTASDGALTTQQALAVTVTDFAEPPSVLIGDAGANTLNGTTGADGIWAGAGNDTLNGGGGDDLLFGEDGDDKLYGGSGNDTLTGGTGNDYLDGGSGNDALVGGSGNDTYVVDAAGDVVVEAAGGGIDTVRTSRSSYALGDEVESLVFTGTGNFSGTGNALANAITGGAGNDTLDGSAGNDTLIGGAGNDTYVVDAAGDVVSEAADGGTDLVKTALATYTLGNNVENLTYTGSADFLGTGNALANTVKGGTGNDVLSGGAGNDTLYGLSGDDTLDGGTGADTLIGGSGNDTYLVDSALDVITEYSGGGSDTVRATASSYALSAEVEVLTFVGTEAFTGTGNASANTITGGSGNDTLDGGDGADTLIGGAGSDSLIGGAGNDTLDGGTGNDTLTGGAGNDTYVVDAAGDVIVEVAGGGTDTVRTTRASYTLGAELENLAFIGTGSFTGTGNAANNVLTGGAGNDTLDGGAGNDTLVGGLGNDTYVVDTGDTVSEAADGGTDLVKTALAAYTLGNNVENLTYTGTAAFTGTGNSLANTLKGGAGNDVLSGGSGNDTLYGLIGNDTLDGGSGADTLIGGSGDDTYVVDNSGDVVSEYAGGGTDTVRTALTTYTLGGEVENLTFTGSAGFTGTGNSLANVITGGSGNDTLDGKAGYDTLIGGAGNDTYVVDAAGDVVVEAAGGGTADQVRTGLSAYTLGAEVENLTYTGTTDFAGTGNALANALKGGTGHDVLTGGDGDDTLYGLSGNDTLDGGTGTDTLIGGSGNDTYLVDSALDVITEYAGGGTDTALSTAASFTLAAEVENLTFAGAGDFTGTGNGLANILTGGSGNDTLNGATGNDTLLGGLGADALTGGTGADVFVYTDAAQSGAGLFDTIADFSAAEGDLIDLSAIDANSLGGTADDAFVYVGAAAFSGTAGELRFSGGQLQGDTNGDGTADLVIALSNTTTLSAGSIRL